MKILKKLATLTLVVTILLTSMPFGTNAAVTHTTEKQAINVIKQGLKHRKSKIEIVMYDNRNKSQ